MSGRKRAAQGVGLAAMLAWGCAGLAADPATLARNGGAGVAACASCHGGAGQGQGSFPRLAGMNAAYLARQLEEMASGRRASPVMQPIARALAPGDRNALAAYYARLPHSPAPAAAPASAPGGRLALHGAWSKGVPACVQCHGPGGRGVGAAFPAIAGQPAGYLAAQLRAFREGRRANDPIKLMRAPASKLTDEEIDAVSQWFSSQPARTPAGFP